MDHERAVALFPEWRRGELSDATRAELERHLEQCEPCRQLAETFEAMDEALLEHPSSEEIVAFAIDASGLRDRSRVAEHVELCAECALEVQRTREAEGRVSGVVPFAERRPRSGWSRTVRYAAIAASILLMVLVYDDLRLRRAVSVPAGGAASFKVLSSGVRGPEEIETILVATDQAFVPIGVEVDRAATLTPDAVVEFEIRVEDDSSIWRVELAAERVQRDIRETGLITLLVPESSLAADAYELQVTSGGTNLLTVPFRVARE